MSTDNLYRLVKANEPPPALEKNSCSIKVHVIVSNGEENWFRNDTDCYDHVIKCWEKWDSSPFYVIGWLEPIPVESGEDDIVRKIKVRELLGHMIECDKELYEKILDTDGFAYYFNELSKLAQAKVRIVELPPKTSAESNQDEYWDEIENIFDKHTHATGGGYEADYTNKNDFIQECKEIYHLIKKIKHP